MIFRFKDHVIFLNFENYSTIFLKTIDLNINRLNHLLKLFGLSEADFLHQLNIGREKLITRSDIFKSDIKISHLKKVDNIFNQGLSYYIDPEEPRMSKEESIFFRKESFNGLLNLSAKKIVNHFEEEKIRITSLAKLSDLSLSRVLPKFTLNDSPKETASNIRKELFPKFNPKTKEFLKSLIYQLAENKIFVFEFIETWNKKNKANVEGFFLAPNTIVLKRQQKAFRREIFTLVHELGHYLLNVEEIDEKVELDPFEYDKLNRVEKWCNDFAYYFLIQDLDSYLLKIDTASARNDYHHNLLDEISSRTHLSMLSLYTRLLLNKKISINNYNQVKSEILQSIKDREDERRLKEDMKEGVEVKKKGSAPKPIISPLFIQTLQSAYLDGIIGEMEYCRRLNLKPDKIELAYQ